MSELIRLNLNCTGTDSCLLVCEDHQCFRRRPDASPARRRSCWTGSSATTASPTRCTSKRKAPKSPSWRPGLLRDQPDSPLWRLHRQTGHSLVGLARAINPVVRGWIQDYGAFYRTALHPLLQRINAYLVRWLRKKYKRLRGFKKVDLPREPRRTDEKVLYGQYSTDERDVGINMHVGSHR